MTRARAGFVLLNLGAVLMILGALFDLSISAPPAQWASLLGQPASELSPRVTRLLMALLHALGSVLLAAAIATLLLVNGPVRRRDRWAGSAVLVLALIGEGGNGLQMVLLGAAYGWVVLAYIVPILVGLALVYVPARARPTTGSSLDAA